MMPLLSPPSSTTQEEMVRARQSGNCKWKKQQRKVKQKNKPAYRPLDLLWFGEIRSWSQSAVRTIRSTEKGGSCTFYKNTL